MEIITCPLCQKTFDSSSSACPNCGYPYKFMVEQQEKYNTIYTEVFFEAIKKHNRDSAIKAIGVLEFLSLSGLEMFYALIDKEDGYYDLAIAKLKICLERENPKNQIYHFYMKTMMECLALKGDISGVQIFIQEHKDVLIDYWMIYFYIVLATKNLTPDQYSRYLSDKVNGLHKDELQILTNGQMNNTMAKNDLRDLFADIFTELIVLLRELVSANEISNATSEISLDTHMRPSFLRQALEYSSTLLGEDFELTSLIDEVYSLSKIEFIGTDEYKSASNRCAVALNRLLFSYRDYSVDHILRYIHYLIRIDALQKAKNKAVRESEVIYAELLKKNHFAEYLIMELDSNDLIDENTGKLYLYREKNLSNNEFYVKRILKQKAYKSLSRRGLYAFQVAEWMFKKSWEEDYSWKDAGPISLNYFRIIELEFNQRLITPLLEDGQYKEISKVFKNEKKALDEDDKKSLENRFGIILSSLKRMSSRKGGVDGLELGVLDYFLKNIIIEKDDSYSIGDKTAEFIFNKVIILLTDEGRKALLSGEMRKIISSEKREKYRNPPAHTRYLPYSVACECREFVIDAVYKLSEWLVL